MEKTETRESVVLSNHHEKIFGILHRPITKNPVPAVMICHGFGGNKLGKNEAYLKLAKALSKAGIAVLRFDFRGCGDSEGDFSQITVESLVSDALAALEFLKNDPGLDKERFGIFGRSLGGSIALITAKRTKAFKTIVLWAPFFSAVGWLEKWKKLQSTENHSLKQDLMTINGKKPSLQFYEQLFRMHLDQDLKDLESTPFLHIQGKNDLVITEMHAQSFREHRKMASGESKFVELIETDHDFSNPEELQASIEDTVEWFKRTLKVE